MADNMNIAAVTPSVTQADKPKVQQPDVKVELSNPAEASKASVAQATQSVAELKVAIEQLNEFMKQGQRSLSFSVEESVNEVVVRVVDTETQELVRQIPNEETLRFKEYLEGMLGMLFSDKA